MSLFKWSTPERRMGNRILPIIPNEIYLHLFDFIAPPNQRLASEEIHTFTSLSRVCRFFANVCLPRVYYFVELSGSIFRNDTPPANDTAYKPSRGGTLCTQIAAKQPLALALAKTVRACRFTGWHSPNKTAGSWAVGLFLSMYTTALSHMTNLRELTFHKSCVDNVYWRAIAMLSSGEEGLETLSFDVCTFQDGLADVGPHARTKIRVSRLCLTDCIETHQPVAAVDLRYLRTLVMDASSLEELDWLPQSSLGELYVHFRTCLHIVGEWFLKVLHAILTRAPRSLETLWLFIDVVHFGADLDKAGQMFADPVWQNVPLLRSLTLSVWSPGALGRIVPSTLGGISRLTQLQSFTVKDYWAGVSCETPSSEVLRIIRDKLGTTSNLKHVDIYGAVFRLADGEWSEVSY